MRTLKIQPVKVQTKEREKRRSGKITNKGTQKGHPINNKESLLQIPTKSGALIKKRRSVSIVKRWVMMNINVIINILMN